MSTVRFQADGHVAAYDFAVPLGNVAADFRSSASSRRSSASSRGGDTRKPESYSRQVWPGERDLIGEASGNDDLAVRKHEACPTIGKHSHDHRVPPEFVPPEFRRKSDPTRAPAPSATPGCSGRGNILAQRGHASRWHRCCATGRDAGPHRQHVGRLRPPADPVPGTKRRTGQQRCSERARATPRGADRAAARRETAGWPWSMTHAIARYR